MFGLDTAIDRDIGKTESPRSDPNHKLNPSGPQSTQL